MSTAANDTQANIQLLCGACGIRNRLPFYRVVDAPACGHCHAPLLDGRILSLRARHLPRLLECRGPVAVIGIWPRGPEHRKLEKLLARSAAELQGQILLFHTEDHDAPLLHLGLCIQEHPTLLAVRDGHVVARRSGRTLADLPQWLAGLA